MQIACKNKVDYSLVKRNIETLSEYDISLKKNLSKKTEDPWGIYYKGKEKFTGIILEPRGGLIVYECINGILKGETKGWLKEGLLLFENESFTNGLYNEYDETGLISKYYQKNGEETDISIFRKSDDNHWIVNPPGKKSYTIPVKEGRNPELQKIINYLESLRTNPSIFAHHSNLTKKNGEHFYRNRKFSGFSFSYIKEKKVVVTVTVNRFKEGKLVESHKIECNR